MSLPRPKYDFHFFERNVFILFASFLKGVFETSQIFKRYYLLLKSKNLKIKIFRTIILPVVLYRCESWSLTLREERRLRVFENRVLRIFVPKRDRVTGMWGKLYNEELNNLYSSPNIFRVIKWRNMRWAGHVARIQERRVVYRVLVGKPEGKRPLGRPRRR